MLEHGSPATRIPYTLIRNWQEEYHRSFEELQTFLNKRAGGNLEVQRHQRKLEFHSQPVEAIPPQTPFVYFKQPVQLQSGLTRLAVDLTEQHSAARVAATRLAAGQPIFRTAFLLHPSPDSPQIAPWLSEQRDKSILHHGETVAISLLAPVENLFLCSSRDPITSQLMTGFAHFDTQAAAWQVLAADPVQRELCLGLPVASGDTVVLLHSSSGHFLCVGRKLVENDFGIEAGVVTGTVHGHGKRNVCERASQGDVQHELAANASPECCWRIITDGCCT